MYPGGEPLRPGVDSFGFPSHFHDMLHEFPICHVNALLAGTLDTKAKDPNTGTASPPLINKDKPCYPKKKKNECNIYRRCRGVQKQNEKFICLNVTDSEQSVLTTGDSRQNKPEVKQQGRSPEEQSMEASSDANRSDVQEKEDREKRKEAKVGGLLSNHTHHRANFSVSDATTDVSVVVLLLVGLSFSHNLRVKICIV